MRFSLATLLEWELFKVEFSGLAQVFQCIFNALPLRGCSSFWVEGHIAAF